MSRSGAAKIVNFLSFANRDASLQDMSNRQWNSTLQWLNDSGLAFYFLKKLKSSSVTRNVPDFVVSRLQENFAANCRRAEHLANRLQFINSRFAEAQIRFAVLKGVSLVPDYCPHTSLRHQSDLDYLIPNASLDQACRILVEAGYLPKHSRCSQEFAFYMPGRIPPSRSDQQYSLDVPESVELHVDIWDGDLLRVHSLMGLFSANRTITHQAAGFTFPALDPPDAFLLQVLHAMAHIFDKWIKVASLFEIAYLLHHRAADTEFWNTLQRRLSDNIVLRDFVVIIAEMSAQLFAPALPELIQIWGAQIRPASRLWIDRYARTWTLGEIPVHELRLFPTSKLSVFLHRQYRIRPVKQAHGKPAPSAWRFSWIAFDVKNNPSLLLDRSWWKKQRLPRRCTYHALAYLRYFVEAPRWLWRNRMGVRSAAPNLGYRDVAPFSRL